MNSINICNNDQEVSYGTWDEQLWAALSQGSDVILGLITCKVTVPLRPEKSAHLGRN